MPKDFTSFALFSHTFMPLHSRARRHRRITTMRLRRAARIEEGADRSIAACHRAHQQRREVVERV
jgi:hypothetical protein